jgi:hypothetical protein
MKLLWFLGCLQQGHMWIGSRRFPGLVICRRCGAHRPA